MAPEYQQPFLPVKTERPPAWDYQYTVVLLTVEVGFYSIRQLFEQTGIDVSRLEAIVDDLERQYYVRRCNDRIHRQKVGTTTVPAIEYFELSSR